MGKQNQGRWRDKQPVYQGTLTTLTGTAHRFASGDTALPQNRDADAVHQAWVMENWRNLAALAWLRYQQFGRCALLARFKADGALRGDVEVATPAQLAQSRTRASAEMLLADLAAYDPAADIVMGVVVQNAVGRETTWVYKMQNQNLPPPEAYRQREAAGWTATEGDDHAETE